MGLFLAIAFAQDPQEGGLPAPSDVVGPIGAWITYLVLVVGNLVTLYFTFRKKKREENQGDFTALEEQQETRAKVAWEYARKREAQHNKDMQNILLQVQAHRQELNELRVAERQCALDRAIQGEQIKHQVTEISKLRQEIEQLKDEMHERGVRERTDEHPPLGGEGSRDGDD